MNFTDYGFVGFLFLLVLGIIAYAKSAIDGNADTFRLESESRDASLGRRVTALNEEISKLTKNLQEDLIVIKTKVHTACEIAHQANTASKKKVIEHRVSFDPMKFKVRTPKKKVIPEHKGNA